MSASKRFADVQRMLNDCAPGSTVRIATHSRVISYNGRTYPSFPKFDTIELGHIRKLVRNLQISDECVEKHLPGLHR